MSKILLTITLVFGVFSTPVLAVEEVDFQLKTTQDLLDLCTAQPGQTLGAEAIHFCEGYIVGAVDYHDAIVGKDMKRIICYPKGTTRNDAMHVLAAWEQANQGNAKLLSDPAMYGLVRAMQEKWPCKK